MTKEIWIIDVTNLNNSWRLPKEIKMSNCKIIGKYKEVENVQT